MSEMNVDVFDKLDEKFDIKEEIQKTAEKTKKAIVEVKNGIAQQKYNLEDKEYLKTELQDLISTNRMVLETLAGQIKFGCDLGLIASFANISKTITENLSELIKLEKQVTDYQITESNENIKLAAMEQKERIANNRMSSKAGKLPNLTQTNNIFCSNSRDALDMILNNKQKPELVESEMPNFKFEDEGAEG